MPEWWRPVVVEFIRRVTPLFYGSSPLTVSSFVRGRIHNREVGGDVDSQHLIGTAVDLVPGDGDMVGLEQAARDTGAFGFVLNEGTHVHVQLYPKGYVPGWIFDQVARA